MSLSYTVTMPSPSKTKTSTSVRTTIRHLVSATFDATLSDRVDFAQLIKVFSQSKTEASLESEISVSMLGRVYIVADLLI